MLTAANVLLLLLALGVICAATLGALAIAQLLEERSDEPLKPYQIRITSWGMKE